MKDERIYHSNEKTSENVLQYLDGKDVCRYEIKWGGNWLKYGENLAAPRVMHLFNSPRILVRQIPSKPPFCIQAAFTQDNMLNDRNSNNVVDIQEDPNFILAIINSKLTSFWFLNKFDKFQRGTFPQFKVKELALFRQPIHLKNQVLLN